MTAVGALLSHSIDYAGMFPPAGLDLQATVQNYETYRAGPDSWALGRLILPVKAVREFVETWPSFARDWPISLLLGPAFVAGIREAEACGLKVDAVECKPSRVEEVAEIQRSLPRATVFVEIAAGGDLDEPVAGIAGVGACAKVRTGGVTASAIPSSSEVAQFLCACAGKGVRLKATAGLHHAIRAEYPLTYEAGSERAVMHGFVNFFVAATIALAGTDADEVEEVLADETSPNFAADDGFLRWGQRNFSAEQIARMRERFLMGFGSCSFTEPLEDMRAMGWLR
jgi:hypothetical protein